MNQQNFINGLAKFPVSTETLNFIQEQILLTARLASIAGANVIITPATTTTDGLVVVNGEILPLRKGTAKQYIQVVETKQSIVAGTQTFTDVRITRYAQYANGGTSVSNFTTLDNIVRLMARINAIETTYMTKTDIQSLVQGVETNLASLSTIVKTIENNYKTTTQINELFEASAKHYLPKATVIDWYGANLTVNTVPEGFVPCGYFACSETEENLWKKKFSNINTKNKIINGTRYVYICQANGQSVPDLTDRFVVQAGCSYAKGKAEGKPTATLTIDNMPSHKHNVAVNATGSEHAHRLRLPASSCGNLDIDASAYVECSTAQGKSGNEAYLGTATTVSGLKGEHTHTVSETSKGGGKAFSILPPYFALYKLIKVI